MCKKRHGKSKENAKGKVSQKETKNDKFKEYTETNHVDVPVKNHTELIGIVGSILALVILHFEEDSKDSVVLRTLTVGCSHNQKHK
jgi:hypothetical protein